MPCLQRGSALHAIPLYYGWHAHDADEKLTRARGDLAHLVVELIGQTQGDVLDFGDALPTERDLVRRLDGDGGQNREHDDEQETLEEAHSSLRINVRDACWRRVSLILGRFAGRRH